LDPPLPEAADAKSPAVNDPYPGYPPEAPNWRRLYTGLVLALVLPISAFALWKYVGKSSNRDPGEIASETNASMGVLEIVFAGGFDVYINDELKGTTPFKPLQLKPQVYHLRYEKDGKEAGREDVNIVAGKTTRNMIQEPAGKLVLIVVPASGVQLTLDGKPYGKAPESLDVSPGIHQLEFTAEGYSTKSLSAAVTAGGRAMVPVLMKSLTAAVDQKPKNLPPPPPPPSPAPANRGTSPGPSVATGTVRWTALLVDFDIYQNDRRLGSTPMTLDLPAGSYTFEYRHEGLKKTATLNVQPGATTTASANFEITVNIQAKPYADVFLISGETIVELKQTPLLNVTVPVGGTLEFRYLNMPAKRYRVTAKDANSSISVSFQ
jgi:hypothetical protein